MTIEIALGVDDIGHPCAGAAEGKFVAARDEFPAHEVLFQSLHLVETLHHEFDVVTGGEAHETAAVLVCDLAHLTDMLHGHEAATADPEREELVPGFGDVYQDARFQD